MRTVITREEAMDMEDAHGEGLHEELPRDGCPTCQGRNIMSYPTAAEVAQNATSKVETVWINKLVFNVSPTVVNGMMPVFHSREDCHALLRTRCTVVRVPLRFVPRGCDKCKVC